MEGFGDNVQSWSKYLMLGLDSFENAVNTVNTLQICLVNEQSSKLKLAGLVGNAP